MRPWLIFFIGSILLALVTVGGFLLYHHKSPGVSGIRRPAEDANILYLLLGLASLSILAYIAFTFGKR